MTMIIRIKFNGLDLLTDEQHMEEVMKYCEREQKVKVNDEEQFLKNDFRAGQITRIKSNDHFEGTP